MTVAELVPGDRPGVRFKETWFHPQGGGQKADRGVIAGVDVIDVRHSAAGNIDHILTAIHGLEVGGSYPFNVNAEGRRLNSAYHTAAHLLVSVCHELFQGLSVAGGHQWPGEARVEFIGDCLDRVVDQRSEFEQAIQRQVDFDLAVRITNDPSGERLCQIGDYPPIQCSGTHVSHTSAMGQFRIRSAKIKKGRLRIGYEIEAP